MWVLEAIGRPEPQSQPLHYYLPAGIFSVGRVTGGVSDILCNHQSISRKHAEIRVAPMKAGQKGPPEFTLTDSSRYGTLVNGEKLVGGQRELQSLPLPVRIQFGFRHTFSLRHEPALICGLHTADKSIRQQCRDLGFDWTQLWSKTCTHMLCPEATFFSPILAAALIGSQRLVTAAWVHAWRSRQSLTEPEPDAAAFLPAIQHNFSAETRSERELTQAQLEAVAKADQSRVLSGTHFCLVNDLQDREAVQQLLRAAGGHVTGDGHPGDLVHVLNEGQDAPADCKTWTTTSRILTALVQASKQGLLVFNPVAGKRLRQNAVVKGLPVSPPRKRARAGQQDQSAPPLHEAENLGAVSDDATDADEDDELQPSNSAPANDSQQKKGIGPTEGASTVVNMPLPFKRAQAHEPMQRSDQDNFKAYLRGGKRKVNGTRGRVLAVITGGISAAHIDSLAFLKAEREHASHQRAADDLFGAQVRPKKMQSSAVRGRGRGRGLKTTGT